MDMFLIKGKYSQGCLMIFECYSLKYYHRTHIKGKKNKTTNKVTALFQVKRTFATGHKPAN